MPIESLQICKRLKLDKTFIDWYNLLMILDKERKTVVVNVPRDLKEVADRSSNGLEILQHIWPPSGETAEADELLETLRQETSDIERWELVEFFKSLEEKGYGNYIVGRRGWSTRIEWSEKARRLSAEELDNSQRGRSIAEVIDHKFNLRPGFEVFLSLPEDLTSKEAERLSSFVKTLPFNNEKD